MMPLNEIIKAKFPDVDFMRQVILQDDGKGAYIAQWGLDSPQPTDDDLVNWSNELETSYKQQEAVAVNFPYPSVEEQLKLLWDAMDSGQLSNDNDFYRTVKVAVDARVTLQAVDATPTSIIKTK